MGKDLYKVGDGSIFLNVKFYEAYSSRDQLVTFNSRNFRGSFKVEFL